MKQAHGEVRERLLLLPGGLCGDSSVASTAGKAVDRLKKAHALRWHACPVQARAHELQGDQ